jgi:hypothetical protein
VDGIAIKYAMQLPSGLYWMVIVINLAVHLPTLSLFCVESGRHPTPWQALARKYVRVCVRARACLCVGGGDAGVRPVCVLADEEVCIRGWARAS